MTLVTLDRIKKVGQFVRVRSLKGDDPIVQRLMEMGLLEDEEIEIVGFAPLGDPMEIMLRGYRLSLRKSEASRVEVVPL